MKKMTYFVMALAMALGFTQCKKEQIASTENEGEKVTITLKLNNGSRGHIEPGENTAAVVYDNGDVIMVGFNGAYVGDLTTTDGSTFSGNVNISGEPTDGKIHFYYLDGKSQTVNNGQCTVDISDQTSGLPVISYACVDYRSDNNYSDVKMRNQCALVKFDLGDVSTDAAITLTGLKTEATIGFGGTVTNGTTTGNIVTYGTGSTRYAVVLSDQAEVTEGTISAEGYEGTFSIPTAAYTNAFLTNATMTLTEAASTIIDLADVKSNTTVGDGAILTGTLGANVKISIADGATVTLNGVSINGENDEDCSWAGITCLGNATIILKDGSENTVRGFYENYPGIYAVGYTLTIKGGAAGTGKLTASSNGSGAGIGGGYEIPCGSIEIQGGVITATGGVGAAGIGGGYEASCGAITISGGTVTATGVGGAAGIGSGYYASCGAITISGGTVTATGGSYAAGIGSGYGYDASCDAITVSGGTVTATGGEWAAGIGSGAEASCGDITITTGVTSVTATKDEDTPNSIGAGDYGTCGTVTIGGTVYYENNAYVGTGSTYLTQDQIVYPQP